MFSKQDLRDAVDAFSAAVDVREDKLTAKNDADQKAAAAADAAGAAGQELSTAEADVSHAREHLVDVVTAIETRSDPQPAQLTRTH